MSEANLDIRRTASEEKEGRSSNVDLITLVHFWNSIGGLNGTKSSADRVDVVVLVVGFVCGSVWGDVGSVCGIVGIGVGRSFADMSIFVKGTVWEGRGRECGMKKEESRSRSQ